MGMSMGNGPFNPSMGGMPQQKINIDVKSLEKFLCPNCGNEFFADAQHIKLLPRLVSPAGEAGAMFINAGKICTACGWMADIGTIAQMCKDILEGGDDKKSTVIETTTKGKVE